MKSWTIFVARVKYRKEYGYFAGSNNPINAATSGLNIRSEIRY
jgi:hypothetical protein